MIVAGEGRGVGVRRVGDWLRTTRAARCGSLSRKRTLLFSGIAAVAGLLVADRRRRHIQPGPSIGGRHEYRARRPEHGQQIRNRVAAKAQHAFVDSPQRDLSGGGLSRGLLDRHGGHGR